MSQIVTGEAVALDLRIARIGSRSVATFLDVFIQILLVFAFAAGFGEIGLIDSTAGEALVLVVFVAILVGYPVGFETLWRGRTPGKAAMGLRVVRDDGGPVRFRHALIRGLLGGVVEGIFTAYLPAILSSLASERGKRLGDRAAGTVVIQERVPSRAMAAVPMPAPLAQWASTVDLSRVSNELALAIRQFFERSGELSPAARDQLGHSLTSAVVSVITPAPPPGAPAWAILAAVVAERRRRDELRMHQQRLVAGQPPVPSWQGPTQPGWGTAQPTPAWQASAPRVAGPPPVPPAAPLPQPPYYGAPPPIPPAPPPVPAPAPVPAPEPPPDGFTIPS